jgi:TonB-linked SusC/RagA family outer membrane protein
MLLKHARGSIFYCLTSKHDVMKKLQKHFLFLLLGTVAPLCLLAQFTVTGTVTGSGNIPLSGATIKVKNSSGTGAATDAAGKFSLPVPGKKATLEISFIGYKTQAVSVDENNNTISVLLAADIGNLDEVVVTGLGTSLKRANLANAVSSVSARELTGTTTQATVDGALYGKFTGANISANSGAPGGGISVKLRGITSIAGNSQPLFIVDGVYYDNSSINPGLNAVSKAAGQGNTNFQDNPSNRIADLDPEDIDRVEILKGASAAAIYGSRAAGGVVIITTKKGKAGKPKIELSHSLGVQWQLKELGGRSWDTSKVRAAFGQKGIDVYAAGQGKIYNYEDELYGHKGIMNNTRLSISGGGDRTTYFAGVTYKKDEAIVKNTGYEKMAFRINLDQKVFSFLDLALNFNYVESTSDRGFFNNDNTSTTMGVSYVSTPWWANLYPDANGNYPNNPLAPSNFLQTRDLITNREKVNRNLLGGTATFKIFKNDKHDVQFITRGGIDYYTLNTLAIFPKELQFEKDGNGTNGLSAYGTTVARNSNMNAIAVYNFTPSSKLNFRTQGGLTAEDLNLNNVLTTATQLIGTQTNVNQAGAVQAEQTRTLQKDRGFFVQEEVNFNDIIIATAGLRGDRSSRNGDASKLYYFPKASIAFNVSDMDFWNLQQVSQLKLRAAYGESGNFAPFGAIYTPLVPTIFNGTSGSLIGVNQGNELLEPERQKELEFGLDFSLLKSRISFEGTYYIKKADNLILLIQAPTSSGFSNAYKNVAAIRNRGVELALNLVPVRGAEWRWNIQSRFWKNNAEVTRLDVPAFNTGAFGATLGTYRIQKGKSPTQVVGIAGPNDVKDPESGLGVFGDAEPDFQLSFTNNVTWKNFELTVLSHWKKGGKNINLSTLLSDIYGTSPDFDDKSLDPTGQQSNGAYRLAALGTSAAPWVESGTYFRVREIGLSYKLPDDLVKGIDQIKIGVSGRNLINSFKYSSYDPEVSNFGINAISSNVEVTPYPSSKSVHFNLSVTF